MGARPRRGLRRRHGGDPDRQGDRRQRRRHVLGRQGRNAASSSVPTSCSNGRRPTGWRAADALAERSVDGIDVVLDVVGGDEVDRNLTAVRPRGTIVQVGLLGGGAATVNVGALLSKRIHWIGTVLRARPLEEKITVEPTVRRRGAAAVCRRAAAAGDRSTLRPRRHRRGAPPHGGRRQRRQAAARHRLSARYVIAPIRRTRDTCARSCP